MKEKWTKGPWEFVEGADNLGEQDDNAAFALGSVKGGGKYDLHICRVWNDINDDDEMSEERANAHLIAAAPELFEALAALVEHDEMLIEQGVLRHFVELERAASVLKKAMGEE